jgi:putative phosphoribosyl transferase
MVFANRGDAGKSLATHLLKYADVLILALPGGGVPVAFEVAQILKVPLDIFFVRKVGQPECEELSVGSISSIGEEVLNEETVLRLGSRTSGRLAGDTRLRQESAKLDFRFG